MLKSKRVVEVSWFLHRVRRRRAHWSRRTPISENRIPFLREPDRHRWEDTVGRGWAPRRHTRTHTHSHIGTRLSSQQITAEFAPLAHTHVSCSRCFMHYLGFDEQIATARLRFGTFSCECDTINKFDFLAGKIRNNRRGVTFVRSIRIGPKAHDCSYV